MATANDVNGQFMGDPNGSLAGNSGWTGLAPQPDNKGVRWSVFRGEAVDRQSIVEALGTLVFEATFRIKRRLLSELKGKQQAGDTVLGHAVDAASYGAANHALLVAIAKKQGVDVDEVLKGL